MKPIVETLAGQFYLTNQDRYIADAFKQNLVTLGVNAEHLPFLTNIAFLLAFRPAIDVLLKELDDKIYTTFIEENNNEPLTSLKTNITSQHIDLSWPFPTEETVSTKSAHLLSRVLLEQEQAFNINLPDSVNDTIPTLVGLASDDHAANLLKNGKLWNDEPIVPPIFFHGKMTHRIQINLLLAALKKGWIDLDTTDGCLILRKLATIPVPNFYNAPAWTLLLDSISNNSDAGNYKYPSALNNYSSFISQSTYSHRYLFTNNPYFFHSYLLTTSSSNTPNLTALLQKTFCHSAYRIQSIEYFIGEAIIKEMDSQLCRQSIFKKTKLTPDDLTMKNVLARQASIFSKSRHDPLTLFVKSEQYRLIFPKKIKKPNHKQIEYRK